MMSAFIVNRNHNAFTGCNPCTLNHAHELQLVPNYRRVKRVREEVVRKRQKGQPRKR